MKYRRPVYRADANTSTTASPASASRSGAPCSTSTPGCCRWPGSPSRCASCPTPTRQATSTRPGRWSWPRCRCSSWRRASTSSTSSRSSSSAASTPSACAGAAGGDRGRDRRRRRAAPGDGRVRGRAARDRGLPGGLSDGPPAEEGPAAGAGTCSGAGRGWGGGAVRPGPRGRPGQGPAGPREHPIPARNRRDPSRVGRSPLVDERSESGAFARTARARARVATDIPAAGVQNRHSSRYPALPLGPGPRRGRRR